MKKIKKNIAEQDSKETALLIAKAALDKKAEDLVVLDVRGISSFTDFFVIASGRSTRHVQGVANAIDKKMSKKRLKKSNTEGLEEGLWVLLDYSDVVVHLFYKETRGFYDLEGIWHDAKRVAVDDDNKDLS